MRNARGSCTTTTCTTFLPHPTTWVWVAVWSAHHILPYNNFIHSASPVTLPFLLPLTICLHCLPACLLPAATPRHLPPALPACLPSCLPFSSSPACCCWHTTYYCCLPFLSAFSAFLSHHWVWLFRHALHVGSLSCFSPAWFIMAGILPLCLHLDLHLGLVLPHLTRSTTTTTCHHGLADSVLKANITWCKVLSGFCLPAALLSCYRRTACRLRRRRSLCRRCAFAWCHLSCHTVLPTVHCLPFVLLPACCMCTSCTSCLVLSGFLPPACLPFCLPTCHHHTCLLPACLPAAGLSSGWDRVLPACTAMPLPALLGSALLLHYTLLPGPGLLPACLLPFPLPLLLTCCPCLAATHAFMHTAPYTPAPHTPATTASPYWLFTTTTPPPPFTAYTLRMRLLSAYGTAHCLLPVSYRHHSVPGATASHRHMVGSYYTNTFLHFFSYLLFR